MTDTLQRTKQAPCSRCGSEGTTLNGAWFRRERIYYGVSLREMARRLGVSPPFVSDMERGFRHFLPKYAAAYDALGAEARR
ncbi:MAG TPA: helix-turn-helix transcriptional regulator [Longimicrobiaceae bacterium]|nr:helix-turn-helix transcriptional regulator [Longimicrobiaceae bacterium]